MDGETVHVVALGIDPDNAELDGRPRRRAQRTRRRARGASATRSGRPAFRMRSRARCDIRHERAADLAHALRALPDRDRLRARHEGRLQALPDDRQARLCAARLGDAAQAVGWIHGAGGQAVIAHPGRYKLTRVRSCVRWSPNSATSAATRSKSSRRRIRRRSSPNSRRSRAASASRRRAARDFHGAGESRLDFGDLPPLPAGVDPVWSHW